VLAPVADVPTDPVVVPTAPELVPLVDAPPLPVVLVATVLEEVDWVVAPPAPFEAAVVSDVDAPSTTVDASPSESEHAASAKSANPQLT
jgi:hypothetical protein